MYKEIHAKIINKPSNRPKLIFTDQIAYLKSKGVKFEIMDEEKAETFLQNNNYLFKIKAYAENFSVYSESNPQKVGQYVDLDFAYLVELSTIDMYLREKILKLSLNVEHYLKLQILRDITLNDDCNGYEIVHDFLTKIRPTLSDKIQEKGKNSYCKELIQKRSSRFAAWDLIEVLSFGDFVDFYNYYYSNNNCSTKNMSNNLKSVQWIRNAAAHNNCILNHLDSKYVVASSNREVCYFVSLIPNISQKTRTKKMETRPIHDFVVLLYVFDNVVSSDRVKYHTLKELKELFDDRFVRNKEYFKKNPLIESNYIFVKKIIDFLFDSCNND